MLIHRYTASLVSDQARVQKSLQYWLDNTPSIGIPVDEAYQFEVRFRPGVSLMQPVKQYRPNVILCATFTPTATRFGAIYANESTSWQWGIGTLFVNTYDFRNFFKKSDEEQMIMLGFRPN